MFSFFKNKYLTPRIELQIHEFRNSLRVSKKIPNYQINSLIKNLKKTYTSGTNLTFAHLEKAFSKDKSFPQLKNEQKKLGSLLAMELRISDFRTTAILNRERQLSVGITQVEVSFIFTAPYCKTMDKYRKKYDGKIVDIKKFPILPLYHCLHCMDCIGRVVTKSVIPGLNK